MRHKISVLSLALMLAGLTACGKNDSGGISPTPPPPPTSTTEPPPATSTSPTPVPPDTTTTRPTETTTSTPPPPPVTVTIPPPAPKPVPPPCTEKLVQTLVKANPVIPGSRDHYVCTLCGKTVPCAPASPTPPTPPPAPALSQAYLDSLTNFPSSTDHRPDAPPYGPCHDAARQPIPCTANRWDVGRVWLVPLPNGHYLVLVFQWLKSGPVGVDPKPVVGHVGGDTVITWPVAATMVEPIPLSKIPDAAVPDFRAYMARMAGKLTRLDFCADSSQIPASVHQ